MSRINCWSYWNIYLIIIKIVFPIHPRTINNLKKFNLYEKFTVIKNIVNSPSLKSSFLRKDYLAACDYGILLREQFNAS